MADNNSVSLEERQLVIFDLAAESYGVDINAVQGIIRMQTITKVPRTPEFVEGVINLRGEVIPVVDLRKRFGLTATEETKDSRIVVVYIGGQQVGMVVDAVTEVLRISADSIEPPRAVTESSDGGDAIARRRPVKPCQSGANMHPVGEKRGAPGAPGPDTAAQATVRWEAAGRRSDRQTTPDESPQKPQNDPHRVHRTIGSKTPVGCLLPTNSKRQIQIRSSSRFNDPPVPPLRVDRRLSDPTGYAVVGLIR